MVSHGWQIKRAQHAPEKSENTRYGEDSGQDRRILEFLGVSAEDFQEAAVNNPNDVEIGDWVLEASGKGADEITAFNERMANWGA